MNATSHPTSWCPYTSWSVYHKYYLHFQVSEWVFTRKAIKGGLCSRHEVNQSQLHSTYRLQRCNNCRLHLRNSWGLQQVQDWDPPVLCTKEYTGGGSQPCDISSAHAYFLFPLPKSLVTELCIASTLELRLLSTCSAVLLLIPSCIRKMERSRTKGLFENGSLAWYCTLKPK